jgi:hypothetical protein
MFTKKPYHPAVDCRSIVGSPYLTNPQIVYIAHVVVAAVRYDVYGFIYIISLGIWKNMSSRTKSKMCMSYIVVINVLIAIQYFLLLG